MSRSGSLPGPTNRLTRVGGERAANAPSREAEIGYGQARPGWKPQLAHIHCDIKRT